MKVAEYIRDIHVAMKGSGANMNASPYARTKGSGGESTNASRRKKRAAANELRNRRQEDAQIGTTPNTSVDCSVQYRGTCCDARARARPCPQRIGLAATHASPTSLTGQV